MHTESIKIPIKHGLYLAAVLHYPPNHSDLTDNGHSKLAVLTPGYLDSKDYDHLIMLADQLTKLGYVVVRFDPFGTWESSGTLSDYTVVQQLEDTRTVIDYMLSKQNYSGILLGGHSRGGFVSIIYAVNDPRITKVLAIMPPYQLMSTVDKNKLQQWEKDGYRISTRDVPGQPFKKEFKMPYANLLADKKFNVLEIVNKLTVPLILVAGGKDTVVDPLDVKKIFDKANEPKQMILLDVEHGYRREKGIVNKVNEEIIKALI